MEFPHFIGPEGEEGEGFGLVGVVWGLAAEAEAVKRPFRGTQIPKMSGGFE